MNSGMILGQVLMWAGFLSGALATVFRPEVDADPWSTINWPWYTVSALVCLVGVVLIRRNKQSTSVTSDSTSDITALPALLESLAQNSNRLYERLEELRPSEMVRFIEDKMNDDLREFAESRNAITEHYDLQRFAEVMTQFASGERSINRAWSAAADGYVDEVRDCVERAAAFFQAAHVRLTEPSNP